MARHLARKLMTALLIVALGIMGPGALAEEDEPSQDGAEPPGQVDVLSDVVVTSGTYAEAVAALEEATSTLATAEAAIRQGELAIPDLEVALDRITSAIPRLRGQLALASDIEADARSDLTELVALRYAADATEPGALSLFGDPRAFQDERRLHTILDAAQSHRRRTMNTAGDVRDDAARQLEAAGTGVGAVRDLLTAKRIGFGLAMSDVERLDGKLDQLEAEVSVERRLGIVGGSDLTFVALEAYVTAAATTDVASSTCGLDWAVLAAIGRVESRHGTYGDTALDVEGQTDEDIIGIALDGTRNTREIRDTDEGRLDGDPVYDRAVGPMQFIPTTWAGWARDGDGDGVADPHNLYDAATAAGAYLCRAGAFTSETGARRALYAYNRSDAYVDAVLAFADHYRSLGIVVE